MASDGDGEMEVEDHNRDMLESQVKQIEQEIRDVKTKLYQQKLSDIRKEIEKVRDGSHLDLLAKQEGMTELREKRVATAGVVRTLMYESSERVYKAEMELATLAYGEVRQTLYNEIMSRLQAELTMCERDRRERDKALTPTQDKATGRLRGPRTPRQPASPTMALLATQRKVTVPTGRPIIMMLSETKIEDDLKQIKSVLRQQGRQSNKSDVLSNTQPSDMCEAMHVNGSLHYNEKVYNNGDGIWVESPSGRYTAMITSINVNDIVVKRGQQPNKRDLTVSRPAGDARIYITGLKLGKYKIRPWKGK